MRRLTIWSPSVSFRTPRNRLRLYPARQCAGGRGAHALSGRPLCREAGPGACAGLSGLRRILLEQRHVHVPGEKYLSELAKFRPDILEVCTAAVRAADSGSDFISIPHEVFSTCPDESVDYAVMEKTADAVVVGLDADWSDVGSWSALWDVSPKDELGNVLTGDAWVHNSQNCYINSDEKLVAAIGVEDW